MEKDFIDILAFAQPNQINSDQSTKPQKKKAEYHVQVVCLRIIPGVQFATFPYFYSCLALKTLQVISIWFRKVMAQRDYR